MLHLAPVPDEEGTAPLLDEQAHVRQLAPSLKHAHFTLCNRLRSAHGAGRIPSAHPQQVTEALHSRVVRLAGRADRALAAKFVAAG